MKQLRSLRTLVPAVALLALPRLASAEEPFRFEGTTCTPAAYLHCPDTECSAATVINEGNVVEMKTRRTYFLDYPCDLNGPQHIAGDYLAEPLPRDGRFALVPQRPGIGVAMDEAKVRSMALVL